MNIGNYLTKMGKAKDIKRIFDLAETKTIEKSNYNFSELAPSGDYQLVIAIGKFDTGKYGEIMFDENFCQQIVSNWKNKVLGNRQPFVDVEHDMGEAQGWIVDMRVGDKGLECKFDWTPPGALKVQNKLYKYLSAGIARAKNIESGDEYYPVLAAVSLTNTPVLNVLPEVHLSERLQSQKKSNTMPVKLAKGKAITNKQLGETNMSWEDILKAIASMKEQSPLTQDQIQQICEAAGMDVTDATEPGDESMADDYASKKTADKPVETEDAPAPKAKKFSAVKGLDGIIGVTKSAQVSESEKPPEPAIKSEKNMSGAEKLINMQQKQIELLMGGMKKLTEKQNKVEKDEIIQKALSEGKIMASMVKEYEELYSENPELVKRVLKSLPANALFVELGNEGGSVNADAKQFSNDDIQIQMKLQNFSYKQAREYLEKYS